MEDFINLASQELGTDKDTARSAAGSLLGLIKDNADGGDVSEMFSKLPGAEALAKSPAAAATSGGLGGLMGGVAASLGGKAGGALGAVQALSQTGLSADKVGSFVGLFKSFAAPLLGGDLLKRLLSKVPGLSALLG